MKTLTFIALLMLTSLVGCARLSALKSTPGKLSDPPDAVRISVDGLNAAEPAVAASLDGNVYVAWVAHGAGKEADVWLTRLERAATRPSGEPARVNTAPGEATAWRGDAPDVAVARDGTVYVAWTARASEGGQATTLYVSASRDGGRSFGAPVRVNDDSTPGVHGMHSLAVGEDGRVFVAWLDERDIAAAPSDTHASMQPSSGSHADMQMHKQQMSGQASGQPSGQPSGQMSGQMHGEHNREVFFSYSTDGGRTFSANRRIAVEACPCCKTSLAVSTGGRVYVGWRQVLPGDFRHVAVASSTDGGETFSAPTVVSDDRWELRGCPVSGPALAAGDGDRLTVIWYTAGEAGAAGLYSSESSDGGRTFAPRRAVSESSVRGTPQLLSDARGTAALFEGSEGNSFSLLEARLETKGRTEDGTNSNGAARIGAGELPAATVLSGRVYAAYISRGGVWLVSSEMK